MADPAYPVEEETAAEKLDTVEGASKEAAGKNEIDVEGTGAAAEGCPGKMTEDEAAAEDDTAAEAQDRTGAAVGGGPGKTTEDDADAEHETVGKAQDGSGAGMDGGPGKMLADDASAEDGTAAEGIPDGESGEVEG